MGDFQDWAKRQEKLDTKNPPLLRVSEGEIWWTAVGKNIGSEIDGKGEKFSRPVLILKQINPVFYVVLPITSQPHHGPWYAKTYLNSKEQFICLHQVQGMDYRRFDRKIGKLDQVQFEKTKRRFLNLYI